jgi:hypothetical protein
MSRSRPRTAKADPKAFCTPSKRTSPSARGCGLGLGVHPLTPPGAEAARQEFLQEGEDDHEGAGSS